MKKVFSDLKNDWRNRLLTKEGANELFETIGINFNFKEVINSRNVKKDDRLKIKLIAENNKTHKSAEVVINATSLATWDHMMDTTFGFGRKSEINIVVFDETHISNKKTKLAADPEIICSFAKINNDCGLPTFIVGAKPTIEDNNNIKMEYSLLQGPTRWASTKFKIHPSKKEFQKSEFWVVYHDYNSIVHAAIVSRPDNWFNHCFVDGFGNLTYCLTWDDQGCFIDIEHYDDSKLGVVAEFWQAMRKEIKVELGEFEIELYKIGSEINQIRIKLFDTPFDDFQRFSVKKKMHIADIIFEAESSVSCLFMDFYGDDQ